MDAGDQTVDIRPFMDRDLEATNDLLATHRPWTEYDTDFELTLPDVTGTGEVLVATVEGSYAGLVWWLPTGAFNQSAYLKLLGVHRTHQSAGVGTVLMDAAESAVFDDTDISDMFLLVSGFNETAKGFYTRRGYAEIGSLEGYVEPGIDEVLMLKTEMDH